MKKQISKLLALSCLLTAFPFSACSANNNGFNDRNANVLRVASWDEYIDMGGSLYQENDEDIQAFNEWYFELTGIDLTKSKPLYEEFEDWYYQQTGEKITVEYVALQDNETMYSKIKMGDRYDLLCPSEYMMMKLVEENLIQKFPESFFDKTQETNYYAQNVSPYIQRVFESGQLKNNETWSDYIAGYMWGSTGFVFNPEKVDRNIMKSWNALKSKQCARKITAKDNVRDSYFMGLGLYYENELLALKEDLKSGMVSRETYSSILSEKMNDTSVETMNKVKKHLEEMRGNLYGLETDEGKMDVIRGRLDASYQWSGDAVYILDQAEAYSEDEDSPLLLEYSIPESASNLWFDGWVLMNDKDVNINAATAFVNFLSLPQNVIRNMYYIGYTSCIGGNDVLEYVSEMYGATEDEKDTVSYDLSYFFGENTVLTTYEDQTRRQLFAQYPDTNTIDRLVVMKYFDKKTNERANRMWNNIK